MGGRKVTALNLIKEGTWGGGGGGGGGVGGILYVQYSLI